MPTRIRRLGDRSIGVVISFLVISLALMAGGRALAFDAGARQSAPDNLEVRGGRPSTSQY